MSEPRRPPRWTIPFLRALARTGDVRAAAEDAGIDWSTAYQRRKAHPEFADAWKQALAEHSVRREEEQAAELEDLQAGKQRPSPPPSPACRRGGEEELVGGAKQLKRAGHDRWGPRKEKAFFDELAATANARRAARAAGVSPNAVYARRLRDPHFRAKSAAVVESGKAGIAMYLVEAANRTFDPDEELDVADATPRVSVAEAIRITQGAGAGSRKGREDLDPDPFREEAAASGDALDEVRERVLRKLERLRKRRIEEKVADGWSYDEERDEAIPPGWVKAAMAPEPSRE